MHGMDIPWMLRQWAERSPDATALIWEPFSGSARSWTYAHLAFDDDGWFDTGDVIRIDDDGWLFFSDRDKDMLKIGAESVAAEKIAKNELRALLPEITG